MRTRMAMSHVILFFLNNDTVYIHVHVTKVCRPINVDVTHPRARHLIVDYIPHVLTTLDFSRDIASVKEGHSRPRRPVAMTMTTRTG